MADPSRLTGLMAEATRVVIVKPSSLGDIVHTLPAVARLRQRWPGMHLSWVVNTEFAPLLEENPDVDETITFPRSTFRGRGGLRRFRAWLGELRSRARADIALDFQGLLRSAVISRATGARTTVGLSDSREGARWLHHIRVDCGSTLQPHAVQRYLTLGAACGADISGPLAFPLPSGRCPEALDPLHLPRPFLLLHPFSRGKGKSLSPELVARLCTLLAPLHVLLAGRCETTHMQGVTLPPNTTSLLNRTSLPELVWLMRKAHAVISVDSGPMHIAAALTPRLLGLHTWSNPLLVGPANPHASIWKSGHILSCINPDPATCASPGRSFLESDLPHWVTWVRQWPGLTHEVT